MGLQYNDPPSMPMNCVWPIFHYFLTASCQRRGLLSDVFRMCRADHGRGFRDPFGVSASTLGACPRLKASTSPPRHLPHVRNV
eukprot:4347571-Amphidinium_carterae.1